MLTILDLNATNKTVVSAKCDCGNVVKVLKASVVSGNTKSCGCLKRSAFLKVVTKHGLRYTPEYRLWLNIKQRCTNPKVKCYSYYGGRGITLCNEWLNSPDMFIKDMGNRPSPDHQIDRIDNNQGYFKDNCRWVLKEPQMRNTRLSKRWYVYGVEYPSLSVAAERYNTTPSVIKTWCEGKTSGKYSYPAKPNCWSEKRYD